MTIKVNHYVFNETEDKIQLEGRYWNPQNMNICIVASITKDIDWAAYIGAGGFWTERMAMVNAAKWGAKLSEADARYFFPEINLPYRN